MQLRFRSSAACRTTEAGYEADAAGSTWRGKAIARSKSMRTAMLCLLSLSMYCQGLVVATEDGASAIAAIRDQGISSDRPAQYVDRLPPRDVSATDSSTSLSPSSASPSPSPSSSLALTTSQVSSSTSSTSASSSTGLTLPRPFDTSLGNNFTQASCPNFFTSFINNSTFQACVPFSLLLQNSNAFFHSASDPNTLDATLDASCVAPFAACSSLMTQLSSQLISGGACLSDFVLQNPLVVQAYHGLQAYEPLYNAACLKADPAGTSSGNSFPYCYASAINDTLHAANSYLYFLPLGIGLPGGSMISCSACTQNTMAYFATAATNSSSQLNKVYLSAANMIDSACGSNFVNSSAAITQGLSSNNGSKSAGSRATHTGAALLLVLMTLSTLIWLPV